MAPVSPRGPSCLVSWPCMPITLSPRFSASLQVACSCDLFSWAPGHYVAHHVGRLEPLSTGGPLDC